MYFFIHFLSFFSSCVFFAFRQRLVSSIISSSSHRTPTHGLWYIIFKHNQEFSIQMMLCKMSPTIGSKSLPATMIILDPIQLSHRAAVMAQAAQARPWGRARRTSFVCTTANTRHRISLRMVVARITLTWQNWINRQTALRCRFDVAVSHRCWRSIRIHNSIPFKIHKSHRSVGRQRSFVVTIHPSGYWRAERRMESIFNQIGQCQNRKSTKIMNHYRRSRDRDDYRCSFLVMEQSMFELYWISCSYLNLLFLRYKSQKKKKFLNLKPIFFSLQSRSRFSTGPSCFFLLCLVIIFARNECSVIVGLKLRRKQPSVITPATTQQPHRTHHFTPNRCRVMQRERSPWAKRMHRPMNR